MRIAVVVPGRFHAFDLVRALIGRGNEVIVFSNYPRWAVARFGIAPEHVRSFPLHGVLARAAGWLNQKSGISFEASLHRSFGRWASRQLCRERWDVIHAWSGVSEEIYSNPRLQTSLKCVMRGSAHIRAQSDILKEEEKRVGMTVDRPSAWMIRREQREYPLANRIVVLSTFAYNSFKAEEIGEKYLRMLPLGTDARAFRPDAAVIEERRARILAGAPLRVLYVGGISWRKGLADIREILLHAARASHSKFAFRFVGPVWPEARGTVGELSQYAEFVRKKPQSGLPAEYAWGDVFIFPTIEDGYAVVLSQAAAAALPILTTPNCCGPDLIKEGRTGWVLPIRDSRAFIARLEWCDSHRSELADIADACYRDFRARDWSDVAADFEAMCKTEIASLDLVSEPTQVHA